MPDETAAAPPRKRGRDFTPASAALLGSKGGKAKAAKRKLMDSLGLLELEAKSSFRPFRDAAEPWRRAVVADFTKRFGAVDGVAMTMIASAALQLAASRWGFTYAAGMFAANAFDPSSTYYVSGDVTAFVKASQLAEKANASLFSAWEWCVQVAKGKPAEAPVGAMSLEQALE